MHLPRYYLPQPALRLDTATIDACEVLWTTINFLAQIRGHDDIV